MLGFAPDDEPPVRVHAGDGPRILDDHLAGLLDGALLDQLAARSKGFSGADLELCREARWAGVDGRAVGADVLDRPLRQARRSLAGAAAGFRA